MATVSIFFSVPPVGFPVDHDVVELPDTGMIFVRWGDFTEPLGAVANNRCI